jgi:protein involved in polysaccharide export with SLBB domain
LFAGFRLFHGWSNRSKRALCFTCASAVFLQYLPLQAFSQQPNPPQQNPFPQQTPNPQLPPPQFPLQNQPQGPQGPQQGPQWPQQFPQQFPQPYNQGPQGQQIQQQDAITKAQQQLQLGNQQNAQVIKPLTIDPIAAQNVDVNELYTFTVTARDPSLAPGVIVEYILQNAPPGMTIDPNSGTINWIPTQPGVYMFYVWAYDNQLPQRTVNSPVTLTVVPPLPLFGYDYFDQPRQIISYRAYAMRTLTTPLGLNGLPGPIAGGGGSTGTNNNLNNNPFGSSNNLYPVFSTLGQQAAANLPTPTYQQGNQPGLQLPGQQNPFLNGQQGPQGQNGSGGPGQQNQNGQFQQGGSAQQQGLFPQGFNPQNGNQQMPQGFNPQSPFGNQSPFGFLGNGNMNGMGSGNPYFNSGFGTTGQGAPGSYPPGYQPGNNPGSSGLPNGLGYNPPSPNSPFVPAGTSMIGSIQPQSLDNLGLGAQFMPPNGNSPSANALSYIVSPLSQLFYNTFVPHPDKYQLGPGDLLTMRLWSPVLSATDIDLKVDPEGILALPTNGMKISVRGRTLAEAEALIKQTIRKHVAGAQIELTLKALRTMSVTIMGDSYAPGTYQVPAVATLFNTLYMSGGPNDNGSLRNIEVIHTDQSHKKFDLYRLLAYHDMTGDVQLQPGDLIWIPPAKSRVAIQGEVLKPAIYEADSGEGLKQLITFAGGTKPTGVSQRVSLQTVAPGVGRQLRDVDLTSAQAVSNAPVYNGDIVNVYSIRDEYTNRIEVDGAVDQPGQYQYTKGVTVADMIQRARNLLPEAYHARADIIRRNQDKTTSLLRVDLDKALARQAGENPELLPYDKLHIYTSKEAVDLGTRKVTVKGAVQRPGSYDRSDSMKVSDLLMQAGNLTQDAAKYQGFLQRINPDGTNGPLFTLNFNQVAANDPKMNIELKDNDILTVQTVTEASFVPDQNVKIDGALQNPGPFPYGQGMTALDLIKEAGNVMPNAGTVVEIAHARVTVNAKPQRVALADIQSGANNPALLPGDVLTIPEDSNILMTTHEVMILGAVQRPGPYVVNGKTDRLTGLLARAGGLNSNAYPVGTQFYRDPKYLQTASQQRLSPRIMQAFQEVQQDQYTRELAQSEIEKLQVGGGDAGTSASLPGIGSLGSSAPPPALSASVLSSTHQLVTPPRDLNGSDLIPSGNMNIRLPAAMQRPGTNDDVILKNGDIIVVPEQPTTVSVVGAVIVPSAVLYVPGQHMAYYVSHAGGPTIDADKDEVLIMRYNGLVIRAKRDTPIMNGDIIFVPTKVMAAHLKDHGEAMKELTNTLTAGALVLAVLLKLL